LIHMISKMQPWEAGNKDKPGSRIAIVFNGSPLFTGGAGSGESEIRRWIIEHDWLEAIVALPEQMFYNTGIGTFIWVVSNRKSEARKGKIQLIDARDRWKPMKRSLGDKRRYLDQEAIDTVTREHGVFEDSDTSRIFDNEDFGYRRITVHRPLRLRFQITDEAKETFLDACPELLDAVLAIEEAFGNEPHCDWNQAWKQIQAIVKAHGGWAKGAKGTAQKKLFREVFTETDPEADPVVVKKKKGLSDAITLDLFPGQTLPEGMGKVELAELCGIYKRPSPYGKGAEGEGASGEGIEVEYEPDPKLKDFENIPLKEDIVSYFLREVRPYVPDAWIDLKTIDEKDGGLGKVGYEINFNRVFFKYQPPRPLEEIDAELEQVERRIMELLREVTE
ncbi:MAG TPA: SAM-dependent DNA methyltransferase, partial [Gammaproteobacteria bacterium]|nr:SAM-dependent DNA methyltransferase [Gammaproteobacteria bacterium]